MSLTKIGSIGINTGIAFAGVTTIVTLNTANDALSIGATVNVGSGITLGASGDIFATGVSTVTTLKVGSGVTVSSDGDVFFTGIATGNGSGLTALNATQLTSGTVPTARLGSGTASSSTFLRGDSTFQTVNTDLVSDTSPQLGSNLDVNTKNIQFGDSGSSSDDRLTFGSGLNLSIYYDGSRSVIAESGTGPLRLSTDEFQLMNVAQDETMIYAAQNLGVSLNYNSNTKLATTNTGVVVTGICTATSFSGSGSGLTALPISNDVNNRLITATGSATLNGEERLTYDGNGIFNITGTGAAGVFVITPDSVDGGIYFNDGSSNKGALTYLHSNETMNFRVNGTNKLTINSSGNLVLNSGSGIDFSATSDAGGMQSELLADYEEGRYSPTLYRSSSNVTYLRNYGRYIRVGNMCFVWFDIQTSGNNSSGSGTWKVSLPFTFADNSNGSSGLLNGGHGAPSFRDMSFMSRDQGYKTSSYVNGDKIELRYINNSNLESNMIETGSDGRVTGQMFGYLSQA